MVTFDQNELRTIAKLSALRLDEAELKQFSADLQTLLDYIEELVDVPISSGLDTTRNINVFREDKVVVTDSEPILRQAPALFESYYEVPHVLD